MRRRDEEEAAGQMGRLEPEAYFCIVDIFVISYIFVIFVIFVIFLILYIFWIFCILHIQFKF